MRQRVRSRRLKSGLSQAELGRRVGISRVAVCEFEAGRGSLSRSTIERMCDVLELNTRASLQRRIDRSVDRCVQELAQIAVVAS